MIRTSWPSGPFSFSFSIQTPLPSQGFPFARLSPVNLLGRVAFSVDFRVCAQNSNGRLFFKRGLESVSHARVGVPLHVPIQVFDWPSALKAPNLSALNLTAGILFLETSPGAREGKGRCERLD